MTRQRRADPVALVGALGFLGVATYLAIGRTDVAAPLRVFWTMIPFVDLAVAAIAFALSRRPAPRRQRILWYAVLADCLIMSVGDFTQAFLVWTRPTAEVLRPSPLTDLCNLIGTVVLLVALLRHPVASNTWSVRMRYLLDAASVAVGAGVLMWVLMTDTGAGAMAGDPSRLLGAAVLAVAAFASAKLALTGTSPMRARSAAPGVAGMAIQGYAYGLLAPGADLRLPLAALTLAAGMVFIGMRIHQCDVVPPRDVALAQRRYSVLPYVTLFLMFGLVPVVVREGAGVDFWVVIGALFAVTCLVVVRQVLALRENDTLLTRLDASLLEARGLHEQLRHQATHDTLTGLANRALFDERLDAVTGTAAVLLVDLDGFKAVNDTYGHHAGDAVLVAVADRLRACVPPSATAARIGGDEFAVLLPGADGPTARLLVDRFTALLAQPVLVEGVPLRTGASIGVAAGTGASPEALLRTADAAMYAQKRRAATRPVVSPV